MHRPSLLCVWLIGALCCVCSARAGAQEPSAPAPVIPAPVERANVAPDESPLHGFLSQRYRARWTSKDEDHDTWSVLSLDWKQRKRSPGSWISAHVLARAAADLDGRDSGAGFAFDSLSDTYGHAVHASLYDAYVDVAPEDAALSVRVGRQFDWLTPEFVRFDGAAFRVAPSGESSTGGGAYGGKPVHLDDPSREGDSVFGIYAESRPWKNGRVRADWMHLDDEQLLGPRRDDLVALSAWQTWSERWSTDASYSRLEGRDRDVRLHANCADAEGHTGLRLSYYELFHGQNEQVLELDPFTSVLQELFPYRQAAASLTRRLSDHWDYELGVEARRVRDSGDVSEFNRDWERGYATIVWRDALAPGLALSLTGDQWDGDQRDVGSVGADATYERTRDWRASIGTSYALYKYDLFSQSERDDVRTWYARMRWKSSDALSFDFVYDYEDDDSDEFHTVRVGALWRF